MKSIMTVFAFATTLIASSFAVAHDYKVGDISITQPWSKQVPPTSKVAAAFFDIENSAEQDDKLIAAESPIAGITELHEHTKVDGMMKMRRVEGINIPANSSEHLMPGDYHIMFFKLKRLPSLGESFPLVLYFQNAGKVEISVKVEPADYQSESMKKHMKGGMKHH
ncbi:copper chaperone PCu(A)C [Parasalinivibrio latis]|uniref:copper chaperone PCu(A)C n=1 Tax=Parasalinivibrio latis TaxID=2952610 RepID=UPI0030DDE2D8